MAKWIYHKAPDDSVDSEYELEGTPFTIQDCRSYAGHWSICESGDDVETGEFFVVELSTHSTLAEAKAEAERIARFTGQYNL